MLASEQVSQFKFIAKTLPNVVASDTTSSGIIASLTPGPSTENATPNASHGVVNSAHHFQAPEHAQKQAVMSQAIVSVPESPGQILPTSVAQATVVAGVPGQGVFYDGKRMRKTMQRRTVDYNSSITRYLEARKWFKCARNQYALQPQEIYNVDVVPPCGYVKNPINAVTTKFVRTSTNKLRCPIFCVVWTPEGRRLVTGASSGEFTLWNGLTFNFETILQAHDRAVRSMVWSHNDLWLLTGDHGGFIKYWQSNMNNVKMYEAHKEPVRGLSFSPSDNKFASCSDDGLVKVWDFYRCAEERELKGHGTDVKCVDWHPSKGLLVSGCKDSQKPVKLWDPRTGNNICTLHCHKSTVMTAKWNSNGNWLVTGSRDHLLKLFDIRTMKELQTFRGHKKEATVVAWHPVHETLFASGGSDGSLMFWLTGVDEKAGGMEKAHEGIVWSLSWHPLGHILCSGSNDHTSKFWARNRPGDSMTDKYNLDIQGTQEDTEYNDEGATQTSSVPALAAYDASQVIPGVGIPVTASKVVLPDSKDVDVDLYGGQIKDNLTLTQSSSPESSEFPYPPAMNAFKKPGYSIPGLDLTNSQTNPGFNNSFHAPPKLRLPSLTPRSSGSFNPPQGSYPMANHQDNNHFARGPRNGMEQFSPRGPDPNFRHPGPFLPNQHGRFPGPRGPRSGPWGFSPCPPGRNFEFHRPPNDHFMGGRPRNMPPFGFHRGPPPGFQKSPPELQGGQPPHEGPIRFRHESKPDGAKKNIAVHDGQRLNFSQGPRGNIQGGPRTRGPPDSVHMDTQQGGSVSNSPRVERVPGESNMGAGQLGSHEEGFRSRDKWQSDLNERSNDDLEKQLYESQNVSVNPARLNDGHHVGPRPHLNIRPGVHGPKGTPSETLGPLGPRGFINVSGPRGLRRGPLSPNEGQNSGRHFTPRGSRTPPFQPHSSDQWQPELKSPEGDRPSEFKGRSSRKSSRDRSSRDSSPHRNQTKTERQGSESDAPGILGDYQTHVQEMQRGLLENFATTAVGRLFAQPELGLPDIGRPDRSLNRSDKDSARSDDARGRARDWEKEKRSPREKSGDHDRRSELGRPREERPSHRERSRDRQVFDVRPNDRPVRGQPENLDGNDLPANEKPGLLPIPEAFVAMGPMESAGRDQVSSNHRQTERRRDSGRFQDGQNERKGFWRAPLQDRHTPDGQLPGGGQVDEPSVMEDANVKPLMSLLDALPLGNAAAQGGFDNRRRKRSTEHDFDRPSKRVETNESRERTR